MNNISSQSKLTASNAQATRKDTQISDFNLVVNGAGGEI